MMNNKRKRRFRFNLTYRPLVFLGILFIILFSAVGALLFSGRKWDGKERYNIVIADKSGDPIEESAVFIFSIEPFTDSALLIRIPGNTLIDVPFDYSLYPISSVFRLGELEKIGSGGQLLMKSTEISFGILVDGFYIWPGKLEIKDSTELSGIKKEFSLRKIIGNFSSNMDRFLNTDRIVGVADTLSLISAFKKIRTDKIRFIDLQSSLALISEKLPDNSTSYRIDPDALDSVISMRIYDTQIRNESITFEVSNASSRNKLASRFARILTNTGANVLIKSTAEANLTAGCTIIGNSNDYSSSVIVRKLTGRYGCEFTFSPGFNETTDAKIVLGENFMK